MDGNSTWAKKMNMPQLDGYLAGMRNLSRMVLACEKLGVKYVTFYTFSTENWTRPKSWIVEFMNLVRFFFKNDQSIKDMEKIKAKFIPIGNTDLLDADLKKNLNDLVERTKDNDGIKVCLAISYGGRDEITRACRRVVEQGIEITEENISKNLDAGGIPDPDLIIRTSAKQRLSNFMLWQIAYSEFYFSEKFWPEFDEVSLNTALEDFYKRGRTYGK